MKELAERDRFVELRAQGKSFAAIAEEIGVSKTTLITWSREMYEQIKNLRAINEEAVCERYRLTKQHELETLSRRLEAVEAEIEKRELSNVPTPKLYGLLFKLMDQAKERRTPLMLQHTHPTLDFEDIATKSSWEA